MKSKIIGLTGGLGSGKSTVGKIFSCLGVPVYNSDIAAKEMYKHPEVKKKVIDLLGEKAYTAKDEIDAAFIASRVFSNSDCLKKLNSIIHPEVQADFKNWVLFHSDKIYVIKESALLFETGFNQDCDFTVLVRSPLELRIKRVQARDNKSREEVLARIQNQWDDEKKSSLASNQIENNEKESLIDQVLALHDQFSLH